MLAPILIIDDSPLTRKIVEVTLQREGYHGVSFPDGLAAIRWLLQETAPIPALIFLDVRLPKMDGYSVARYIKSKVRYTHVPIVMLTRLDGVIDRVRARLSGASHYVTKPFTIEIIRTLAQQYVGMPVC